MTPSSEEKEISTLLHSFPSLRMEEDKQRDIARHIRQEKELLTRMKRRKAHRKVIGGIAASFAFLFITYQLIPPSLSSSEPSVQRMNTEENQKSNAAGTKENKDAVLTIDRQIQSYVEEALNKTDAAYHPESMTIIVSDPNTGEILGMASRGKQASADSLAEVGRAIPDPVAAFRIVTLAAAVQEGKFNPREVYDSGTYKDIPGNPINDHNNGIGWGKIPFLEGIQRSSNVVFAKLGVERLKKDLLQEYFERFGFGQKTDIGLSYEEAGKIPTMDHPREVALATIGQGGSASAIQQVAAVGAVANGGKLLKPHMTKTAGVDENHAYQIRQVISEETAVQVRDILEEVVNSRVGSAKAFSMEEYPVAGNSGLAQKYDQKGKIMDGKYMVSFIGFAPSDQPKLLVYVVVDDPKSDSSVGVWSREIIAPPFKEVMEKSLKYLQQR
ncbi:peptidoglycan D,D-transpeptidase FtsI family protein [Brevibacillus sp. NRS-1366]|uniref:peptidoglycan D,D-transpeptidase FtsI family protein n=1 Tax=Brevibacillus sp. NRS-1366 TaxID=3233899 RepID=UPI003D1C92B4